MKIFLGLGSNLGDREINLAEAVERIGETTGDVICTSSVYETEPWGFQAETYFLNMVIEAETRFSPADLYEELSKIETRMGRIKEGNTYQSRIIDIDILLYDDVIVNDANLRIPHPRLHERNFVLVPLNEIAPGMMHPVLMKSMSQLMKACSDTGQINLVSPPLVKSKQRH